MPIDDHPRALAVDVLNEIITNIKESRPTRSDGTATTGFVYAQMSPGLMVSPRDFARPWSPLGGSGAGAAAAPGTPPPAGATTPGEPASVIARRAMQAAFNTAAQFDKLLMVTNDGTTEAYSGGGRHLSVQYAGVLQAMEAPPVPDRPAEEQARIDAARAVLYGKDSNETDAYLRYLANQKAYAKAKADFTAAQNRILADPAQADSAPILLAPYQADLDQTYRRWKAQGADEIEAALATVGALGVPMEQGMIDRARQLLDGWSVNLAGIAGADATKVPYTFILPSEWAEITVDDIGWTTLKRETNEYQNHFNQHGYQLSTGNWSGSSSSSSGSAGVGIFGFGFSGTYAESDSQSHSAFSNTANDGTHMASDATDLSIELQYGLCEIVRPWLVTDLFQMHNWYLRGERKGSVSDGTIDGQVHDKDRKLPMIPTHFLVVRNVRITTSQWGSVRDTLSSYWGNHTASNSSDASSVGGSVSIPVWGPFSVSGGYSHSDSHYQGDFKDESGQDVRDDSGAYFEGDTLVINGAQIVAWLGEIMPFAAPLDDPSLQPAG
jgi:hypothetical protein